MKGDEWSTRSIGEICLSPFSTKTKHIGGKLSVRPGGTSTPPTQGRGDPPAPATRWRGPRGRPPASPSCAPAPKGPPRPPAGLMDGIDAANRKTENPKTHGKGTSPRKLGGDRSAEKRCGRNTGGTGEGWKKGGVVRGGSREVAQGPPPKKSHSDKPGNEDIILCGV